MSEAPLHVAGDESKAHPPRTGHGRLDLVIAVSAIVMSAISLFVAIENGRSERDLVAANSWPFLRQIISNGVDEENNIGFGFTNGGVGPAKVKSFEVFYKGSPVSSGLDLLRKCCGLGPDAAAQHRQSPVNYQFSAADDVVIRPGEENVVFRLRRSSSAPEIVDRFNAAIFTLSFRACYCSVLDECWISDLRHTSPTSVSRCTPPDHPFNPMGR